MDESIRNQVGVIDGWLRAFTPNQLKDPQDFHRTLSDYELWLESGKHPTELIESFSNPVEAMRILYHHHTEGNLETSIEINPNWRNVLHWVRYAFEINQERIDKLGLRQDGYQEILYQKVLQITTEEEYIQFLPLKVKLVQKMKSLIERCSTRSPQISNFNNHDI